MISINKLLSLPEVIESSQVASSVSYKRILSRCINEAMEDLMKMRLSEGKNLSIDINNTINLIKNIPNEFIVVAESGIKTKKDINIYNEFGVYNFLIGESLLKAPNIELKIKELLD